MRGAGPKTCGFGRRRQTLFAWRANWLRAVALLMQGKRPAAMEAFRSAYAGFAPENCNDDEGDGGRDHTPLDCRRCFRARLVDILCNDETKSVR